MIVAQLSARTTVAVVEAKLQQQYATRRLYAGSIVAARASELGFKFGGTVASIEVDIGTQVTRGSSLARLNPASTQAALAGAQADVAVASANLRALQAQAQLSQQTEARFRELYTKGHVSGQTYDEQRLALRAKLAELGVAQANLQRAKASQLQAQVADQESRIVAPFSGRVQTRYVDEGSQVGPGQPILRLVETENLEAHIGLPESTAARLDAQSVSELYWGGTTYAAKLKTTLPEISQRTRTVTAIYQLVHAKIPIGSVVELAVEEQVTAAGYWVPVTALAESQRGLWGVYVVNSEQIVERRLVEIVHTENTRAFVRGTLEPLDRIVQTGVHRIVPGQQVSISLSSGLEAATR